MINKISLYLFVFSLALFSSVTVAQEKDKVKDTTQTKIIKRTAKVEAETKDTALYKNIEKFSKESKFTKLLHKAIFEGTSTKSSNPIRRPKNKVYKKYEGKIIRNINIETLDPFGYSVADTTKKPKNWAEETGNKLHL